MQRFAQWFAHRRFARLGSVFVAVATFVVVMNPTPASATWSIVATDPETGEIGAAIASCVPGDLVGEPDGPLPPIVLQPGDSVAVTQAQLNLTVPARIRELGAAGVSPEEILGDLVSPEFDEGSALRQHAIASLSGDVVAFTGDETSAVALDSQAANVSVQGNILVSEAVVGDSLAGFENDRAAGGSLADSLVRGLLAGADAGGDSRCPEQTALFAQIVVAQPGDGDDTPSTILTVLVESDDGQNPVALLASNYADGERGLLDLRDGESIAGFVVRTVVLAIGVAMFIVAIYLLRRGLGSVKARR